ncbi:malto-oligosyltrehalose trehalohydrolase [Rubrobacter radiotolerans]|uniref:Malto-oligosyltrehalose trehalohydrolase n=1 Tax=Rubrobacter radiotolerans TaxID=42256 RepID=A0A023WZG8_RUBRA|nr:malto-oligosyltrehalose trehalohydrolase [Rubrobacter radiotolerans]AHY45478.1 malto-oligosyltrehalose trehalohydrolase [Rubrobacter radiotolerans]MDX5892889.1 malto-oligosyltrehalose trehalohydrolase [Rubrobacter radiotolerans]SMC02691.1 maltooligosyltrehalose trehalohydrolase [Rubrobacter radiotolerans DSM 5868]
MAAEYLGESRTRFSLFAPTVEVVEVAIEGGETFPMERGPEGVFSAEVPAEPGARYRFRVETAEGEQSVPDPASRFQPEDVHGPSEVVDTGTFEWPDAEWRGVPWHEAVVYELHVGTFTPGGTFRAAAERLDYLRDLGVTVVEVMPVSDFPGERNWGYDGVLPYAPDASYGRPEELRAFIAAAHERGIAVLLDVVYNHFGPEGNYLHVYAPEFFTERHETPWGAAVNVDGERSGPVREFFIGNALFWIEEYGFDGLRLDAVHAIIDDSPEHLLTELARRVAEGPGSQRHVHLVLENEENQSSRLIGSEGDDARFSAQWNDDVHHALHVAATGEDASYYSDYSDAPVARLGQCLSGGFAFQGDVSRHRGDERGEPSAHLSPLRFVAFLQNHDQIGNRAFGDRITDLADASIVRALAAVYLLSPQVPMLFMGEEWGTSTPFRFFCDFEPELAELVTEGRRREFEKFPEFSDEATRERIPDPSDRRTFLDSKLRWEERSDGDHADLLDFYRELISVRRRELFSRLEGTPGGRAQHRLVGERGLRAQWTLGDGSLLSVLANLSDEESGGFEPAPGRLVFATNDSGPDRSGNLPGWTVAWYLRDADREGAS